MTSQKQKIVVIVGPTSSGKSDLAVELALRFNGEVVSADSRQVYKGLDIASGKITKEEMKGVPHHLLDIADPRTEVFTVSDFVEHAKHTITDIQSRGKLPIIAGGTMFYIDALLGYAHIPEVPPNEALRKELETHTPEELFAQLQETDPASAKRIGNENKRRLIRALEIVEKLGSVPKHDLFSQEARANSPYDALIIGLDVPREVLLEKIHTRTTKRALAGMIDETRALHKNGLSFARMENLGLEYRALAHFLQGTLTEDELLERIEINDRQYARKQMKWWKRNPAIEWHKPQETAKIMTVVERFLLKTYQ